MAGEQACGRVDAVDHGRCFKPAARGRVAVEGDLEPEADSEVAGTDHAYEEARPALGAATAGHRACHEAGRKERHDTEGDPSARQGDRQVPFLHCAILRDRQPALRLRRYSPAWRIRTDAGGAVPASSATRRSGE